MKNESGNVLFFIMIGVLLYAALSFTMTKSEDRMNLDAQTIYTNVNQVIQSAADIKQGIARVRARNGCTIEQISFDPPPFDGSSSSGDYLNNNSPTDESCHVFSPNGGGVDYNLADISSNLGMPALPDYVMIWEGIGLDGVGSSGCGDTTCTEVFINAVSSSPQADEICVQYNKVLKNDELIPTLTPFYIIGGAPYNGTFTFNFHPTDANFKGKKAFCQRHSGNNYFFIYTLIER